MPFFPCSFLWVLSPRIFCIYVCVYELSFVYIFHIVPVLRSRCLHFMCMYLPPHRIYLYLSFFRFFFLFSGEDSYIRMKRVNVYIVFMESQALGGKKSHQMYADV